MDIQGWTEEEVNLNVEIQDKAIKPSTIIKVKKQPNNYMKKSTESIIQEKPEKQATQLPVPKKHLLLAQPGTTIPPQTNPSTGRITRPIQYQKKSTIQQEEQYFPIITQSWSYPEKPKPYSISTRRQEMVIYQKIKPPMRQSLDEFVFKSTFSYQIQNPFQPKFLINQEINTKMILPALPTTLPKHVKKEEENLLEIALNSRREKESVSDMRMSLIELPNTSGWTCPKTQVPKQKDVLPQIGFQPESTDYTYAKKSRVLKNRKVEVRDRAQYFEDVVF